MPRKIYRLKRRILRKNTGYKKAGRKTALRKSNLRKLIKEVLKPEVKTAVFTSNVTSFNQAISSSDPLPLISSISQNTTGTGRIGDQIYMKSLNIRGVITMDNGGYTAMENTRIGVRLMVVRTKRYEDYNVAASNFSTDSLKLLEGTSSGFQGYLYDFTTPINRDFFSVLYDRRFYLSRSQIATAGASTMLDKSYAFFNKNLRFQRRKLQYESSTNGASYPVNYPYFLLLGYVKLDGTNPDGGTTTNVEMQYTTTMKYTDD